MEDITLTRVEKKCLYAIKRYPYADIGLSELNGYLHFPPLETTLSAIGKLQSTGMIKQKAAPFHGFQLLESGREYIRRHRLLYLLTPHVAQIISGAAAGIVAEIILHQFGFT